MCQAACKGKYHRSKQTVTGSPLLLPGRYRLLIAAQLYKERAQLATRIRPALPEYYL